MSVCPETAAVTSLPIPYQIMTAPGSSKRTSPPLSVSSFPQAPCHARTSDTSQPYICPTYQRPKSVPNPSMSSVGCKEREEGKGSIIIGKRGRLGATVHTTVLVHTQH